VSHDDISVPTTRDSLVRRLAHEPFGWRPTTLLVMVRRYRCIGCEHVWRQDTSPAAEPRAKRSRGGLRWALELIWRDKWRAVASDYRMWAIQ
jgi:hypothetical protein